MIGPLTPRGALARERLPRLDWLSSPRLAVCLIAVITITVAVGSFIPQESSFGLYSSWWLILAVALLFINTLYCTLSRARRAMRKREGKTLSASPVRLGSPGRWGSFLLHSGLLVILIGILLSVLFGFQGVVALTEGQTFTERHDEYFRIWEGALHQEQHLGFKLRLLKFDPSFKVQESLTNASTVAIIDRGGLIEERLVYINKPFSYRGYDFFQGSMKGFSTHVVVREGDREIFDGFIRLAAGSTEKGEPYHDLLDIPDRDLRLTIWFDPGPSKPGMCGPGAMIGDGASRPSIEARLEENGAEIYRGLVGQGEMAKAGRFDLTFVEARPWTILEVSDDPGFQVVLGGFLLFALGAPIRLFAR